MKEVLQIDEDVGALYPHMSGRVIGQRSRHRVLETMPGVSVDSTTRRTAGAGRDLSNV